MSFKWSHKDTLWFVKLVESFALDPDDITGVYRAKGRMDVELNFTVKRRSRHIFTENLCLKMAEQAKERSGASSSLVYVRDDPHPTAERVMKDFTEDASY